MERGSAKQIRRSASKNQPETAGVSVVRLRSRKDLQSQKKQIVQKKKIDTEAEIAHVSRKGKQGRQRDIKKKSQTPDDSEQFLGKRAALASDIHIPSAKTSASPQGYYGITNVINDFEAQQLGESKFFELVKMFNSPKEDKKLLAFYSLYQQLAAESDSTKQTDDEDGMKNLLAKAGNGNSFLSALLAKSMAAKFQKKKTGATLREKIFEEGLNQRILTLVTERLDFVVSLPLTTDYLTKVSDLILVCEGF